MCKIVQNLPVVLYRILSPTENIKIQYLTRISLLLRLEHFLKLLMITQLINEILILKEIKKENINNYNLLAL